MRSIFSVYSISPLVLAIAHGVSYISVFGNVLGQRIIPQLRAYVRAYANVCSIYNVCSIRLWMNDTYIPVVQAVVVV